MSKSRTALLFGLTALCVWFGMTIVWAQVYQAPPASAPLNNVSPVVHVGTTTQTKTGNFMANIMAAATSTWSPRYCDQFGNNCFTAASVSGGSRITQLTAGQGITLTPSTITNTGTIAVDSTFAQRRVLGCPAGQVIRQINADGSVVCETANASSCFKEGVTFANGYRCRSSVSSCGTGTMYYYFICSGGTWGFGSQCTLSTINYPGC